MEIELKPYQLLKVKNSEYIFHLQDCLIGIQKTIRDKSIDMVVTSPPYNIGKDYGKYRDNLSRKEYLAWIDTVFKIIKRVLKKDGSFFLNIGNTPTDQWISHDVSSVARRYLNLQNKITWIKNISINKSDVGKNNSNVLRDFSAGHFKPVNSSRFLSNCYEDIYHFTNNGDVQLDKKAIGVPYQDKSNIGRYSSNDIRDLGNTWFMPYDTIQDGNDRPHPSSFPVKLPETCIKLHGRTGYDMTVLDPFSGIGSTALACLKSGISFIGFEINRYYIDESIRRLNDYILNAKYI